MWSSLVPFGLFAWWGRRLALRELDELRRREENRLALDNTNLVNRAKIALSLGKLSEAQDFWQEALVRYPHFARESPDAFNILLGLERFDEAEALILDRQRREPGEVAHVREYALISQRRGDTEVALRRWAETRRKFPLEWMGYVCGAMCLRKAGQMGAAEELHRKSLDLFPNKLEAWVESAHTAEHQGDWRESMRQWQIVSAKFRHVTADIGIARALGELGQVAEAEQRLLARQGRSPLAQEIPIALARLAEQRGDKEVALQRWADTQRRFPLLPDGYRGRIGLLKQMGRDADLETVLVAAIDRFPTEPWPEIEYAWLEHARKGWAAAATRWVGIRARWPDRRDGYVGGAEALTALGRKEEAAQVANELQRRLSG